MHHDLGNEQVERVFPLMITIKIALVVNHTLRKFQELKTFNCGRSLIPMECEVQIISNIPYL